MYNLVLVNHKLSNIFYGISEIYSLLYISISSIISIHYYCMLMLNLYILFYHHHLIQYLKELSRMVVNYDIQDIQVHPQLV